MEYIVGAYAINSLYNPTRCRLGTFLRWNVADEDLKREKEEVNYINQENDYQLYFT